MQLSSILLVVVLVILVISTTNADHSSEYTFKLSINTPISSPGQSRVHKTALAEIRLALNAVKTQALNTSNKDFAIEGSLLLAIIGESQAARVLIEKGIVDLHNVPSEKDAYELVVYNHTLYLLGNNPRGLLQAVYELQELTASKEPLREGFHRKGIFTIPKRIFHQRFDKWPGSRSDIRYISHLGASHCLVDHDWNGDIRHFQGFVSSNVFPKASNQSTVQSNHDNLRQLINDCLDYGIEPMLWIVELPCQGGPWIPEDARRAWLDGYPADVLSDTGTYQGKVLCFSHLDVQKYYSELLSAFFKEFPEIHTVFLFGNDSGGELCDPDLCMRCKGMSKIDQRDRLIRFLIEEGRKSQPDLRVLTTNWGWESLPKEFLEHQKALPSGSGVYMSAENDGWQAERQIHDFMTKTRRICRETGQLFIGYDDFHFGDDSVMELNDIQDYPLGIAAKVRRWSLIDADGVFDHWGAWNNDISCNSIALRAFFQNPLSDPEQVCLNIARRQYGKSIGDLVFKSWKSLESAQAIISNHASFHVNQWPGWNSRAFTPIPEEWAKNRISLGQCPKLSPGGYLYNPNLVDGLVGVCQAWKDAKPHLDMAVDYMQQAVNAADKSALGYQHWWNGSEQSPTRHEHLRRQLIYQKAMRAIQYEIGLCFGLQAIYERVNGDADLYRRESKQLLQEDMKACLDAANFLEQTKISGDDRQKDRNWVIEYRNRAAGIKIYLLQ